MEPVTAEEDVVVAIDDKILDDGRAEANSMLLGKLLTDRSYNKKMLKPLIGNL